MAQLVFFNILAVCFKEVNKTRENETKWSHQVELTNGLVCVWMKHCKDLLMISNDVKAQADLCLQGTHGRQNQYLWLEPEIIPFKNADPMWPLLYQKVS